MKRYIYLCFLAVFMLVLPVFVNAVPNDFPANIGNAFAQAGLPMLDEKQPAKDFTLKLVDGGTVRLSSLKGKVVFLNFWATWCPPCRIEMPSMEALYQHFRNSGLEFVAVDIGEDKNYVAAFIKRMNINFPVALDEDSSVAENYGISVIPTTFIVGKDGNIIIEKTGSRDWHTPEIINAFDLLIKHNQ